MSFGEGIVTWHIDIEGPMVKVITTAGEGVKADNIIGFVPPEQAREIARTLMQAADHCEQREGIPGVANHAAVVNLPTIRHTLPGIGGR